MFIWEAGRDVCRDRTFARTGRLLGRDVCRDGTFARTGRLLGRDVCRDGTFAGTGRLLGRAYMRMYVSTRDDFTRDNLQSQHNIVPAKRCKSKLSRFYSDPSWENRHPALPGRGKKRPGKYSFHINGTWWIRKIYMHGHIPFNVPYG